MIICVVCTSLQAKSKELHASLTESALVLSGAAVLQAEAAAALSAPKLGLLKAKRSLDLLCTRVRENLQSAAAASGAAAEVVVTAELDCMALAAIIRTSGAVRRTFAFSFAIALSLCPHVFSCIISQSLTSRKS